MDRYAILSLVDGLVRSWNERDLDRFMSYLDDAVVWSDPAMLYGPAQGSSQVREFCNALLAAFPDFTYRIREPICIAESGERCAILWEISATHLGTFHPSGFKPTNQLLMMQGVDILEFLNGKITRIDTYFNVVQAAEQALHLRLLPKRNTMKDRIIIMLQRVRAYWLRHQSPTLKGKKSNP
jgi:predicted ester cyclase